VASLTKRSLFSVGDGGFAVTIPKSWASFYELKAKDRLIVVSNGFLVFVPEKMAADREVLMRILKKLRVK
jgi:bifunctional DNA-binding transcriptional regulator/antitoxin component of YhaV-PrlF toxin-antitoxin module